MQASDPWFIGTIGDQRPAKRRMRNSTLTLAAKLQDAKLGGATTERSYYTFNGQRVAIKARPRSPLIAKVRKQEDNSLWQAFQLCLVKTETNGHPQYPKKGEVVRVCGPLTQVIIAALVVSSAKLSKAC